MQYAIARIVCDDLAVAEKYLDMAYGLVAGNKAFDTLQLDNTKARLLLLKCLESPERMENFSYFKDAHTILRKQMRDERRSYYPYRIAKLYGDFSDKVAIKWSFKQREIFRSACEEVLRNLNSIDPQLWRHADIQICEREIKRIISLSS